jgi:hypothetical protein
VRRNRNKKKAGVLSVPMTEGGAKAKPMPGNCGSCTGRRAAARHGVCTAPRLRHEETSKQGGGTPGNSPKFAGRGAPCTGTPASVATVARQRCRRLASA